MGRIGKEIFILFLGFLALFYMLIDPLQFDLIPDFIPLIGWLDDGMAITVLVAVFKHYGVDLTNFFGEKGEKAKELDATFTGVNAQSDSVEVQDGTQKVRIPRRVLEEAMRQYGYDAQHQPDGYSQPDPRLTQRR